MGDEGRRGTIAPRSPWQSPFMYKYSTLLLAPTETFLRRDYAGTPANLIHDPLHAVIPADSHSIKWSLNNNGFCRKGTAVKVRWASLFIAPATFLLLLLLSWSELDCIMSPSKSGHNLHPSHKNPTAARYQSWTTLQNAGEELYVIPCFCLFLVV
jgi:hypothetical protein